MSSYNLYKSVKEPAVSEYDMSRGIIYFFDHETPMFVEDEEDLKMFFDLDDEAEVKEFKELKTFFDKYKLWGFDLDFERT